MRYVAKYFCVAIFFVATATAAWAQSPEETAFWDSVKSCADAEEVRLYLQEYPNGHYRDQAKACLGGRSSGVAATWERTFGGSHWDDAQSILSTRDGGYVVAGRTGSKGAGRRDAWVIKLDSAGRKIWERTFGGRSKDEARSIISTPDGGYVVAGRTGSKGAGKQDAWVIKLDGNGRKVWDRTFGGSDRDSANSILTTPDGGYVVAGWTTSKGAGKWDAWVIKLDSAGRKVWDRTFGGSGWDEARSILSTPDGGYVVAGITDSKGAGERDAWVIKLDGAGRKVWDRTIGGRSWDEANSILTTPDGGYVVAGWTTSKGAGKSDAWVFKLDGNGRKVWDRTFGGRSKDEARSIASTPGGGYVVAGWTQSKGAGKSDAWVIKLDSAGRKVWDRTFGGSDSDLASSILTTPDGGYVVAGWTGSTGAGGSDAWVIKLKTNSRAAAP